MSAESLAMATGFTGSRGLTVIEAGSAGCGLGGPGSPLFTGLEPDPAGWRGAVRKPRTLPHYPMVLHRGGYPDGS